MSKAVAGLLPFAAGLAVLGVAIWYLLSRQMAVGAWVLAAFLVGHGLVHLMFVMPKPTQKGTAPAPKADAAEWPFDMAGSWLVRIARLNLGPVRALGIALVAVVAAGFVVAGLATVGVLVPSGWWSGAVGASAAASIVLLVLFLNVQLVLGLAIDAVLLWVVVAVVWVPA